MKASGFYLLLVLLIAPHTNFSQDFDEKLAAYRAGKLIQEFSIVGGPSINFLRGNDGVDDTFENERKYLLGYSFGIQINTKTFYKNLRITTSLTYDKIGGKSLANVDYFDIETQTTKVGQIEDIFDYRYLTIPICVEYRFDNSLSIRIGGYTSYLIKQTREQNFIFNNSTNLFDETNMNHDMNYGLSMGIGYQIFSKQSFSIELQLVNNLGLRNIRPNLNPGQKMKTNNTVLLIEIRF